MADVVHKTNLEIREAVHTPLYTVGHPDALPDAADWYIEPTWAPDKATIKAVVQAWRKFTGGDTVEEMTEQEKIENPLPVVAPGVSLVSVNDDPETTAVDATKGSLIVWGTSSYCKLDDGATTNVRYIGHVDMRHEASGGVILNLVPYSANPATIDNDLWLLKADGTIHLLFKDGDDIRILAAEQSADIGYVYASTSGSTDEVSPGTPENVIKGCTLSNVGGSHWTVENAGTDTAELKYSGKQTKWFVVNVALNFNTELEEAIFTFWVYKGGTQQAASVAKVKCVDGDQGESVCVRHIIKLAQNETLRLMVDVDLEATVVTPRTLNWTVTPE